VDKLWVACFVAAALIAGCSPYEPDLIEIRKQVASGAGASSPDAGRPPAPPAPDPGDVTTASCGDGEVSLSEKCDVAIELGRPGACPTECPPLVDCVARMLNGSNCQAECVVLEQLCRSGDGCCPSRCDSGSDGDCSERCGDGIVQHDEGETCEPEQDADADGGGAGPLCVGEADCNDGDPCTADVFTGSAANCNAACSFAEITMAAAGDGCCPQGANANLDGDCSAACGNGVREPGEECDGSLGCDGTCKLTLTSQQIACLELVEETGNECDRCSCMQCAPQQLACRQSGDALRDMHCTAIIECANDNDCVGTWCYCDPLDFLCNDLPGPCVAEIDAAAAANPGGGTIPAQRADPETAIGRAALHGECNATNCADVCP
jgi:hypothetical protein